MEETSLRNRVREAVQLVDGASRACEICDKPVDGKGVGLKPKLSALVKLVAPKPPVMHRNCTEYVRDRFTELLGFFI